MVDVLININRNIAAGLLADTDAAAAPADNTADSAPQPSAGGLTA